MIKLDIQDSDKLAAATQIVRSVAWGASEILRAYYRGSVEQMKIQENKKDGPVTAADLATNHYILDNLQAVFGSENFAYLSEETHQGAEPLAKDWVWIIDPLDGTRDFIDKTGEYAIHIALTYQKRPVIAVVAVPEMEKIYWAFKGGGTFSETPQGEVKALSVSARNQIEELYLVASRTHRDERFQKLLDRMPFKSRNYVGSVGCKISTILEEKSDVYISLSGKSAPKEWDFAAPELILTEAGGKFSRFDGSEVLYNQGDVNLWGGLMASNGHCHEDLCEQATSKLAAIDQQAS